MLKKHVIPLRMKLRYAREPEQHPSLSGLVLFQKGLGQKVDLIPVKFDDALPSWLSERMPEGVHIHRQAFLKVDLVEGLYRVSCCYFDGFEKALGTQLKKPTWLKGSYRSIRDGSKNAKQN